MIARTCPCRCHASSIKLAEHYSPLLTDPIAALTACSGCEPDHFPDRPYPRIVKRIVNTQADGEGEE